MRLGKIQLVSLWAAAAFAGGCSKNPVSPSGQQPPVFGASDSVFADSQLAAAVSTTYSGPAGFYLEQRPATYAPPLYVSTITVAPSGSFPDRWVELSTEDAAQARTWVVASLVHAGSDHVVDPGPPTVTSRYMEFETYRPGDTSRQPMRAHRASYLDRSGFDLYHPGSQIGVLVVRPVDNDAVRGVAEYLWSLDHRYSWPGPDTKVLTSFSRASEGSILHSIFFVELRTGFGLFGPTTWVELNRDDYRVDSASGAITFLATHVRDL
jgi:hypothetical protein